MDPSPANARASGPAPDFGEVYDRACRVLGAIPGVVTVGYGLKETGGELRERVALLVYVREKVPLDALPPAERVPRDFEGWPTDVVVVPAAVATVCENQAAYPIIRGGIQVVTGVAADGAFSPGTLGCIVRRRGDAGRENVYLLTCRDVLYARGAREGDYVFHDSGAIVVDEQSRAVGLVCARAEDPPAGTPPTREHRASFACHIVPVLDRLGVCIATSGGRSYGSCAATDGSGTAPAPAGARGGAAGGTLSLAFPPQAVPAPAGVDADDQARLWALREAFGQTPRGRELHESFARLRREIGWLVRNSRPVKVAWTRAEGPAFLAHALNHLQGHAGDIPLAVNGVTRGALLERMAAALIAHGSKPLRDAIERWRDKLMPVLSAAPTGDECIARLRDMDQAGTVRDASAGSEGMMERSAPAAAHA